jgi:hypothetical protein
MGGGLTARLCFKRGLTAQTCGLTASGGKPSGTWGTGSGVGMGAALGESSCRKMSKLLVRWGEAEKGEICLIENNGDDYAVGGEIKMPKTFVVNGLSEESTSGGPGCHFVNNFGGEIRIVGTTEDAQVLIGGATPWMVKYELVVRITLVGMRFSRYVVVWSPSTQ